MKESHRNRSCPAGGLFLIFALACVLGVPGCRSVSPDMKAAVESSTNYSRYTLDYDTPVDGSLQTNLAALDTRLRERFGMMTEQTAVGVLDLRTLRLALIHPDRIDYAASVPKIGILLAYFQLHLAAATHLDSQTRRELGLMIKASDNEMAAKYSRQLGLKPIQEVLARYGLYDAQRGG
ncbi:MAG TPA: hypothetical protein VNM37_15725, partial [Candidatus Dormibacteraeota bacterium]|nr:hypothetical protein [Candidatus Dormibacteraeota bacterium]